MKRNIFLTLVGVLVISYSCTLPNGVSFGPTGSNGEKTINLEFRTVSLRFDFSKSLNTAFIDGDYNEFIVYHNVPYNSNYSGAVTTLANILWDEDRYDEDHKPSITVTIEDHNGTQKHSCKKEDITWNTVLGIPNPDHLYKATIEIRSIKTIPNGIHVVWSKKATNDNWPINEFVADGHVFCDAPSITKGGTNNDNGNVAVRDGAIIDNTCNQKAECKGKYALAEECFISPDLQKDVFIGGHKSADIRWEEPAIYKEL